MWALQKLKKFEIAGERQQTCEKNLKVAYPFSIF